MHADAGQPRGRPLDPGFFNRPVVDVGRDLIGCRLLVDGVGGVIVETEAYDRDDPASHSVNGETRRNAAMFGPPGRAYVYRSYGIHWCLNVVCGPAGHGAAVLIRALEPTDGLALMAVRRGLSGPVAPGGEVRPVDPRRLASGPGCVCQALAVTRAHDGLPLDKPPFRLEPAAAHAAVVTGPRIGISRAADLPWRFGLAGSRFVSRPFQR